MERHDEPVAFLFKAIDNPFTGIELLSVLHGLAKIHD